MMIFLLFLQVDSLSLQQTFDLAFENSPSYYESKISLDKSRILFYQSLSNLLPTVSTTASYAKSEYQGIGTSAYLGSASFSMPILDLDVLSAICVAGRQLHNVDIQHRADISNLILKLKTAYYSLINSREFLKASETAVAKAEENLKLVQSKYELGSASRLEMLQGEVFHLSALQDRSKAKTQEITAQEELKSILGINNEIYPTDTLTTPNSTQFPSLDSLIAILQKVNYDIQIAQEYRNIAKLQLVASYLAFLPKVSFFYGYNVSSDSLIFDFQYYRDNAIKNYGIKISFPIFEIKSLIFNYLNAKKDFQLKEFTKKQTIFESEKALRTTYYSLQESADNLLYARKGIDVADEAEAIAKEQYKLGAISLLDYLSTEQDLYNARVSYHSALSNYYIQQANFSYFIGELVLNKEQR